MICTRLPSRLCSWSAWACRAVICAEKSDASPVTTRILFWASRYFSRPASISPKAPRSAASIISYRAVVRSWIIESTWVDDTFSARCSRSICSFRLFSSLRRALCSWLVYTSATTVPADTRAPSSTRYPMSPLPGTAVSVNSSTPSASTLSSTVAISTVS